MNTTRNRLLAGLDLFIGLGIDEWRRVRWPVARLITCSAMRSAAEVAA
ncbi:MAG TPA: hypothetical protein VKS60_01020 [Stellaceae bacterium]|nr:hypothetical protein [Stellaceae bacterium]